MKTVKGHVLKEERRRFAVDLERATVGKMGHDTVAALARAVGCGSYAFNTWLNGYMLPGGKHGLKVLELFGLDSREYGGDWERGFGGGAEGNPKNG